MWKIDNNIHLNVPKKCDTRNMTRGAQAPREGYICAILQYCCCI